MAHYFFNCNSLKNYYSEDQTQFRSWIPHMVNNFFNQEVVNPDGFLNCKINELKLGNQR